MLNKNSIATIVETHFPSFYQEDGPAFVDFIQTYYEWMENTSQTLDYSKQILELRDIDTTVDEFVVHFKEKYLQGLPFTSEFDKRFLVKHIHDLYRSKGTERSIDLLFKLLYRQKPVVYYPGEDVFRASDGQWITPKYLELSPSPRTKSYISKEIVGTNSGAQAFVEKLTKKRINGKLLDVAYISNVRGKFELEERIVPTADVTVEGAPKIVGSLTTVNVLNGGKDFKKGDLLEIRSPNGQGGKARVSGVSIDTGRVNFQIVDGGFGYTTTSDVYVSTKVLNLTGITNSNTSITEFKQFETVSQPMVRIQYSSASNTNLFVNGTIVQEYDLSGAVTANGIVLHNNTYTSSTGDLLIKPVFGNLALRPLLTTVGNTGTMLVDGFSDVTATGNVISQNTTSVGVITVNNVFYDYSGNFLRGATSNTYASVITVGQGTGANFEIGALSFQEQVLLTPDALNGRNTGNVAYMSLRLDGSNSNVAANGYGFPKYPGGTMDTPILNLIRYDAQTIGVISSLTGKNPGQDYNSNPFVLIDNPEVASYDKRDYTLDINVTSGAFIRGEVVRQSANVITTDLNVVTANGIAANGTIVNNFEIGELVFQSNGTANTATGFVVQTGLVGGNGTIRVSVASGAFTPVLDVRGFTTNCVANVNSTDVSSTIDVAVGMVKAGSTPSQLKVKRLTFGTSFANNLPIYGVTSGAIADVTGIGSDGTIPIGQNAVISANVQAANSVVTTVEVIDSGYGYIDGEFANLHSYSSNNDSYVYGQLNVMNDGFSEGYYRSTTGFASADQKLHDNYYYQRYSYEVQSTLSLDKYADVLKQLVHVAGTKMFGKVVSTANADITTMPLGVGRSDTLTLSSMSGTLNVGANVTQGNTTGVVVAPVTATVVISNSVAGIVSSYVGAYQPNTSSPRATGSILSIVPNATANTTTIYLGGIGGNTFNESNNIMFHTGWDIVINHVTNGDMVTGSFVVGETLRGPNNEIGVVTVANSTNITVANVSNNWTTSGIILTGDTSGASANAASWTYQYSTYDVISAINTITVGNVNGHFTTGTIASGTNTATVSYVNIELAQ